MSTQDERNGNAEAPTAQDESDGANQQAPNPATPTEQNDGGLAPGLAGQDQLPPKPGALLGLAGFAKTDAYAVQTATVTPAPAIPEDEPVAPVFLAGQASSPVDAPSVPVGEPAAPAFPTQDAYAQAETFQQPDQPQSSPPELGDNWSLSSRSEPAFPNDSSLAAKDEALAPRAGYEVAGTLIVEEEMPPIGAEHELESSTGPQAFEAHYDQNLEPFASELESGVGVEPVGEQYSDGQDETDTDFLDDGVAASAGNGEKKGGKRLVMVASALIGSLALGGVLVFAYKNSASIVGGSGEAPLIRADNKPVKQAPDDPGGKKFPHQNKLIYDRLQGSETLEVERIVPRQEDVVTASEGASGERAAQPESNVTAASQYSSGAAVKGPKRVKTLVVRPDGTVVKQPETQATATGLAVAPPSVLPEPPLRRPR